MSEQRVKEIIAYAIAGCTGERFDNITTTTIRDEIINRLNRHNYTIVDTRELELHRQFFTAYRHYLVAPEDSLEATSSCLDIKEIYPQLRLLERKRDDAT